MQIKNKKWKLILITVITSFIMITFFDLVPRVGDIATMALKFHGEKGKLKQEMESERSLKDLMAENRMLKGELKNTLSGYEDKENISSVISLLDSVAILSEIRISSIKPQKPYKKDNLMLQPIEVNITSSYERAFNYVMFLEKSSKVILVKDLSILSKDKSKDSLFIKASLEVYLNL